MARPKTWKHFHVRPAVLEMADELTRRLQARAETSRPLCRQDALEIALRDALKREEERAATTSP